jgi:hypothetical protein
VTLTLENLSFPTINVPNLPEGITPEQVAQFIQQILPKIGQPVINQAAQEATERFFANLAHTHSLNEQIMMLAGILRSNTMNHNSFSVTINPSSEGKGLLSFSGKWNAPVTVRLITLSIITCGPITYSSKVVSPIEPSTESEKPRETNDT